MISQRLAAEIRRLCEVEGWRTNTIARHLGVHHGTVTRALARAGLSKPPPRRRVSKLDPYVPFVREIFERYPTLAARVVGGERRLYAFVLVLSYARAFYARFFYDARLPSFLTAHVEAFGFLGGCAKVVQDVPPFMMADGHPARVFGINSVGLERAGINKDERATMKKAFKIIFKSKQTLKSAILHLEEKHLPITPSLDVLLKFLKTSDRGICR